MDDAAGSPEHDGAAGDQSAAAGPSGTPHRRPQRRQLRSGEGQSLSRSARSAHAEERRKVTTAEMWWKQRRPEIVEDFEREVFGRVPKDVPKVTWTVTTQATDARRRRQCRSIAKQLVGHVDNSACPAINVDIQMTLVTPAKPKDRCRC